MAEKIVLAYSGGLDTSVAAHWLRVERGYDAIVLAAAGLKRLGLDSRIRCMLETETSLPAPGQGALAIECRADRDDLLALLRPLNHAATSACVRAERAASRALSGSCQVPLAIHATAEAARLFIRGLVATQDGRKVLRAQAHGDIAAPEALGAELAAMLRAQGAEHILNP